MREGAWAAARADPQVRAALDALNALDTPDMRTPYWTLGNEGSRDSGAAAAVIAAVRAVDDAVLALNILRSEYALVTAPNCAAVATAVGGLVQPPNSHSPPLGSDGNYAFTPEYCRLATT